MTDIQTLLHFAAAIPDRPLDLDAVVAKARRRSLRRWVIAGTAGVVGVVGIGAPIRTSLLSPAGPGRDVHSVDRRTPDPGQPPDREPSNGEPPPVALRPTVTPGQAVPHVAAASVEALAPPARSQGGPDTTTRTMAAPSSLDGYPPAASCSVDNRVATDGEQRTCRFTATRSGGWQLKGSSTPFQHGIGSDWPSATVKVTRSGASTTYRDHMSDDQQHPEGCAENIIQPGDLVEVVLTNSSRELVDTWMTLGAGEHWSCTEAGDA